MPVALGGGKMAKRQFSPWNDGLFSHWKILFYKFRDKIPSEKFSFLLVAYFMKFVGCELSPSPKLSFSYWKRGHASELSWLKITKRPLEQGKYVTFAMSQFKVFSLKIIVFNQNSWSFSNLWEFADHNLGMQLANFMMSLIYVIVSRISCQRSQLQEDHSPRGTLKIRFLP